MYNFVLKKNNFNLFCFFRVVHWTQVRAHMSLHPYCVISYICILYVQRTIYKVYSARFQHLLCTQNPATVYSSKSYVYNLKED